MEGGEGSRTERFVLDDFTRMVLSWSLEDIYNEDLYKNQVEKIPDRFASVQHYLMSFVYPLLEETRAATHSSMEDISKLPYAEVTELYESIKLKEEGLYDVRVDEWRNKFNDRGKEPYNTLAGDLMILVDAKPEIVSDLRRTGCTWTFASVIRISDGDEQTNLTTTSLSFKIAVVKGTKVTKGIHKQMFAIFLENLISNKRIWNALHMSTNWKILEKVLSPDSQGEKDCNQCLVPKFGVEDLNPNFFEDLNESQVNAINTCLGKTQCQDDPVVELIWGPPGTGKTKTTSKMLFGLLKMKRRCLICAPTNVAVKEVASRVFHLLRCHSSETDREEAPLCALGDILIFGTKERLKVDGSDLEMIYLDYRVKRLAACFAPLTGWQHCITSVIDFLNDVVSQYHLFLENESRKKDLGSHNAGEHQSTMSGKKSFLEFVRKRFEFTVGPLSDCLSDMCTHISSSYISGSYFREIIRVLRLLRTFGTVLYGENLSSLDLEDAFSRKSVKSMSKNWLSPLHSMRHECVAALVSVRDSLRTLNLPNSLRTLNLPSKLSDNLIKEFCFQSASLIFCTASNAVKLHYMKIDPIDVLVIDEAAQLKECESVIPFQLRRLSHVILVGDERQLPAMVESKVSEAAGYGRSLFERLSSLGHSKHLLNTQYRMHPMISLFPNRKFYDGQLCDAANVNCISYSKCYMPSPMFGPYSFINITDGREEREDSGTSWRNHAEVAVVLQILKNLYKVWNVSKEDLSIGVISPYAGQVGAIRARIPKKYENEDGFAVKVQTVDGFQGGEMDIIIISSVRSNSGGSIGFLSNRNRTNVALTRARYCMWILGNEKTLIQSNSVWKSLVYDAMDRQCFFNARDNTDISKAIVEVKKEYDQLEDLLNGSSSLFVNVRWKVIFSDNFRKAFQKLTSPRTKQSVMSMLLRLSRGWRPNRSNTDLICERSAQKVKQFKVESFYVLCTVDIEKEQNYIQVLKIWDLLPLEEITKLVKRLDSIHERFTDDYISRCKEKSLEGDLEVPKAWDAPFDFIRRRNLNESSDGNSEGSVAADGTSYAENTKMSESLLLMKFYSLSTGMVSHLLSDHDGKDTELPFEVTEEQEEIIKFQRSSFILGRSGTGKTTILTMKLLKKEQHFHIATNGCDVLSHRTHRREDVDDLCEDSKGLVLRQLFVTVSSKLCFAVKQQVCQLKSFACGGKLSAENSSPYVEFIGGTDQFRDIPDSFIGVSENLYPLIVTFHKFLMMLDGSIGISYFERFSELRDICKEKSESARSLALQTFVRAKEVSYDKFCAAYWPRFNEKPTRKLDPSRVFTEIISHVKGGIKAGDVSDGRLSRIDYVALSEGRASTLTTDEREKVYDIFQDYEQMKRVNGEFDLSDLVNDLHSRLQSEKFPCEAIDFIYIDEVQDLTMRQISLFKYMCRNVDEGYVFAGDTAQTIARGIDFRFEDIRYLFYKEFLQELPSSCGEKGKLSEIFCLSQNFRTHAGVLKLAQSIINLLTHFFPSLVDALSPETSLICGEAPIFLESGNDENVIVSIFGNNSSSSGNVVGFGAEQVILVRDECAREDVLNFVGKKALVLTIVECKGLEFQDVLLYNFFGTSPLKTQWRVIYEYMNNQDLLDDNFSEGYPHFDLAKHNIMCSELKQLYVAITRTRQRLWICENMEGFSKPIFDYWKKLCLIQVRKLDDDLAEAMKVASTPEEWKTQGYKLLREANYEMATMCFERAGYTYGEKLAKAFGLNAAADQMHVSNQDEARLFRRQAAEIFYSIGMKESAAKCFYALEEYERAGTIFESIGMNENAAECFILLKQYQRAGRIYLDKGDASGLKKAGECFVLAGCYSHAADVYAKGHFFSDCLSVCSKGKLFELGLQYIEFWKGRTYEHEGLKNTCSEIELIEKDYLESCALHYHKQGDRVSMMKFVKAISSVDAMRNFLKVLGYIDELLSLEEELGNFMEAANIAKMKGDLLTESYMLGKGGRYEDASMCILWYVLINSLWGVEGKGWPLKQLKEKEELLEKAKSYAMLVPEPFSHYVQTESAILLERASRLSEVQDLLHASKEIGSLRGEIFSSWKVLDMHLCTDLSKFSYEDYLVLDLKDYAEERISQNKVSVETLVHYWAIWRDKIVHVIQNLACLETQEMNENKAYAEFCLSYLGVLKHYTNSEPVYLVLNPDADWVRNYGSASIGREGKLILMAHQLVSTAQRYWGSELTKVGMKAFQTLSAICDSLISKLGSNSKFEFIYCKLVTQTFEVASFLLESEFLKITRHEISTLQNVINQSSIKYFDYMCPFDWRKSLRADMVCLRGTEVSTRLLKETVNLIVPKAKPSYGQVGRLLHIILGSGKLLEKETYSKISKCFEVYPHWKAVIECLCSSSFPELSQSSSRDDLDIHRQIPLILRFHEALRETFQINWRIETDYMSPVCFLYLLERLLVLSCFSCCDSIFATKSGFVEWLNNSFDKNNIVRAGTALLEGTKEALRPALDFIRDVVRQLLYNPKDTIDWIVKSGVKRSESDQHHRLLVLKLLLISYVLFLNFNERCDLLADLLRMPRVWERLPPFIQILEKGFHSKDLSVELFTAAFREVNDPLLIVCTKRGCPRIAAWGRDAIVVDMSGDTSKERLLETLFPDITNVSRRHHRGVVHDHVGDSSSAVVCTGSSSNVVMETSEGCAIPSLPCSAPSEEDSSDEVKTVKKLWRMLDALKLEEEVLQVEEGDKFKEDLDRCLSALNIALNEYIWKAKGRFADRDGIPDIWRQNLADTINDFKQLSAAFDIIREPNSVEKLKEIVERLQSRRAMAEPFLYLMFSEPVTTEMVEAEKEVKDTDVSSSSKLANDGKAAENKSQGNNKSSSKGRKKNSKKKKGRR